MPIWSVHILAASDRSLVKENGPQADPPINGEKEHCSKTQDIPQATRGTSLELFPLPITGPSVSDVCHHQIDTMWPKLTKQSASGRTG